MTSIPIRFKAKGKGSSLALELQLFRLKLIGVRFYS